jgi:translation initiation factor IF-2
LKIRNLHFYNFFQNTYTEHKEIHGAQGVKIAAKDLEKAIAGLNILVAYHPDEVEFCKLEIQQRYIFIALQRRSKLSD